jgi:membrane-associated protease RseP (regulator of RpoE activity)
MLALVALGGPFSVAILMILGAHECGHYLMARRYGMLVTPPFFLPAPIPPIGTFGAVIKMRSPMLHRRALLDIGLAGPIAGMVVAMPFLIYGVLHGRWVALEYLAGRDLPVFGNSLFSWALVRVLKGAPEMGFVWHWLGHPFAWAGWIGLLVTSLNLLPVGQLDGGHVAYALVGRRQRNVAWFVIGMLLALAHRWLGWVVWCILMTLLVKVSHPPIAIEEIHLGRGRRAIGWAALALFVLIFMPIPVEII